MSHRWRGWHRFYRLTAMGGLRPFIYLSQNRRRSEWRAELVRAIPSDKEEDEVKAQKAQKLFADTQNMAAKA